MTFRLRDLESEDLRWVVNASDTCYKVCSLRAAEQGRGPAKLEIEDYLFFPFSSHCLLFF